MKNRPVAAYQVCQELNHDNEAREIKGLLSAMRELQISDGTILTFDQEDIFVQDDVTIKIKPVWKWAS